MTTPLSSANSALDLRFKGLALLFLATFSVSQFILLSGPKSDYQMRSYIFIYATPFGPTLVTSLPQ